MKRQHLNFCHSTIQKEPADPIRISQLLSMRKEKSCQIAAAEALQASKNPIKSIPSRSAATTPSRYLLYVDLLYSFLL